MKVIGLTGGIGSGKTTVAHMFAELGVPVYNADDRARLISERSDVVQEIEATFGKDSIGADGKPDRAKLAELVFSDKVRLSLLNGIIHPKVREDFETWKRTNVHATFVLREAAILFESGSDADCDLVITVVSPLEDRIARTMNRSGMSREAVEARMANQWSDEMRIAKSDFVLHNENLEDTRRQVKKLYDLLNNM